MACAESLSPELQQAQTDVGPLAETRLGPIRGVTLTSRAGREYSGFLGVPYARPPVGPLRFQVRAFVFKLRPLCGQLTEY